MNNAAAVTAVDVVAPEGAARDPAVQSFYHLAQADVRRCGCQGLACFVARHLDQDRWRQTCADEPRV